MGSPIINLNSLVKAFHFHNAAWRSVDSHARVSGGAAKTSSHLSSRMRL